MSVIMGDGKKHGKAVNNLTSVNILGNCVEYTDMRIVPSTASMLEEPYWRIEEPNPMMAEPSEARNDGKEHQ